MIVDANNLPLAGVNVIEKGTNNGAITGADGKFSLAVSSASPVLQFSFIGYETQEVTVGTQTTLEVTLIESLKGLNEVIVIGYGTAKKKDITGSVASVSSATLQKYRLQT